MLQSVWPLRSAHAAEIGAAQEARQQAAHSLAHRVAESERSLGAIGSGRGTPPCWTPLTALEEGEEQLSQLHGRAVEGAKQPRKRLVRSEV